MAIARLVLKSTYRRPLRTSLTAAAIAIGTATVVGLLSISQSAAGQIADRLSVYDVDTVSASMPESAWSIPEEELLAGLAPIDSITAAGSFAVLDVASGGSTITTSTGATSTATVIVASAEGLLARGATFDQGAMPSSAVADKDPSGVVVGAALAKKLGLSTAPGSNEISVGGQVLSVVGVARDGDENALVSISLVISPQTATYLAYPLAARPVLVRVKTGANEIVALALPIALAPTQPQNVTVSVAPTPDVLKGQLSNDTRTLVSIVALVVLVTTSFGIATTMQMAAWERRSEIGVRRAMGESRGSVARTFLLEAIAVATAGSTAGWALGVVFSSLTTTLLGWRFLLPGEAIGALGIGLIIGAISGVVPAVQASRVDPIVMIRN